MITIKDTIDGFGWYANWLAGEDCDPPTNKQIIEWITYAGEILETFKNHPDIKEIYE